uniref:LysM peptidoglycan-binding domain-containing protein n=1 Tax=Ponticaulis koreensis TaxID=1123045 RepID=UPI0005259649
SADDVTTAFEYDDLGRVAKQIDAEQGETEYVYDTRGNVIRTQDANGGLSFLYYDRLDRVELSVDAEGYATSFEYDANGNVLSQTRYATQLTGSYDEVNRPVPGSSADDVTTAFKFDKLNRLIETQSQARTVFTDATDVSGEADVVRVDYTVYDAVGNVLERGTRVDSEVLTRSLYYYDARSMLTDQVSASGTWTEHKYDAEGNVLQTTVHGRLLNSAYSILNTARPSAPPSVSDLVEPPAGTLEDPDRVTQFEYDKVGQLVSSRLLNVMFGHGRDVNGNYDFFTSAVNDSLVTSYEYDALGNVVKTIDPNGGEIHAWYDDLGRKTHQLDGEKYLTRWEYDAYGNVTLETRYAKAVTDMVTAAAPPASPSAHADIADRVTEYDYDKRGNRLTETRKSVEVFGSSGSSTTTDATVTFEYNASGQVTKKTEATGEFFEYSYNSNGWLIEEKRPVLNSEHTIHGSVVTPTIQYEYDSFGNLKKTTELGISQDGIPDRVAQNTYDSGGSLVQSTNALGYTKDYKYDVFGRVIREEYDRTLSDGTTRREAVWYAYDVEGRVVSQGVAELRDNIWNQSRSSDGADTSFEAADDLAATQTTYNAFGDVRSISIEGSTVSENYYDAAGRVWRTTSGDGVLKFFMYDANGNQTLAVTSDGDNFSTIENVSDVSTIWGADTSRIGNIYSEGRNATITLYDSVGNAVEVQEPERELSEGGARTRLITQRGFNAFGEVIWEMDARNYARWAGVGANDDYRVDYAHNTAGRVTSISTPAVSVWEADGTETANQRLITLQYYDASGRLVATRDANGSLTERILLEGTGYQPGSEQVVSVAYPDQGNTKTLYDVFGNMRVSSDQLERETVYTVDAAGQVITTEYEDPDGAGSQLALFVHYEYDELGQKISEWNNQLGAGKKQTTDYDALGRVTREVAFGGDVTEYEYQWLGAATSSMGGTGRWKEVTIRENGRMSSVEKDVYDRVMVSSDLDGRNTSYLYDNAGRLKFTNGPAEADIWHSYLNTGLLAETIRNDEPDAYGLRGTFGYDEGGQIISEHLQAGSYNSSTGVFTANAYTLKDQTAHYDALGRLDSWTEGGGSTRSVADTYANSNGVVPFDHAIPAASLTYRYDANGNIRNTFAIYRNIDEDGNVTNISTQDNWYLFDAMNRVTLSEGILENGEIKFSVEQGASVLYDAAGNRLQTETLSIDEIWEGTSSGGGIGGQPGTLEQQPIIRRETFEYDAANRLAAVRLNKRFANYDANAGGYVYEEPSGPGTIRATFDYDTLGRQKRQIDYLQDGTTVAYDASTAYNDDGTVHSITTETRRGNDIYRAVTTNDYGTGTDYSLGAVNISTSINYKNNNDGDAKDTRTYNEYQWHSGPTQSKTVFDDDYRVNQAQDQQTVAAVMANPSLVNSDVDFTHFQLSKTGQILHAHTDDGRDRTVYFTNDLTGQVLHKYEVNGYTDVGDPTSILYRFSGKEMGSITNNGTGDSRATYSKSIDDRTVTSGSGPFYNGSDDESSEADFAVGPQAVTSYFQGSGAGSYTVQNNGESLSSIAAQLWGDSSLWYKLAGVNGLGGDVQLAAGQTLRIPTGVLRNTHNASTFQPYDPADAIGDLSPTAPNPKPKNGNNCGVAGQIILATIAIVVATIVSGGIAGLAGGSGFWGGVTSLVQGGSLSSIAGGGLSGFAAGAAGGAAGSIVSQGVGVATGIQEKFSWNEVGLAALSGGLSGSGSELGVGGTSRLSNAARASVHSVLVQGIGVATGMQRKFSWAGVAAAGVGSYAAEFAAEHLPGAATQDRVAHWGNRLASNTAGAIANAATRTAIEGGSFERNLRAAIPDVIGQALGNFLTESLPYSEIIETLRRSSDDPVINVDNPPSLQEILADRGYEVVPAGMVLEDSPLRTLGPNYDFPATSGKTAFGGLVFSTDANGRLVEIVGVEDVPQGRNTGPVPGEDDVSNWRKVDQFGAGLGAGIGQGAIDALYGVGGAINSLFWLMSGGPLYRENHFLTSEADQFVGGMDATYDAIGDYWELGNDTDFVNATLTIAAGPATEAWGDGDYYGSGYAAAGVVTTAAELIVTRRLSSPISSPQWQRIGRLNSAFDNDVFFTSSRYSEYIFDDGVNQIILKQDDLQFHVISGDLATIGFSDESLSFVAISNDPLRIVGEFVPEQWTFRGGRYGRLGTGLGIERNHFPPDSLGLFTQYSGPSVQMWAVDHRLTSSWGRSLEAVEYRSRLSNMIGEGRVRDAVATEIRDMRRVSLIQYGTPRVYNQGIREALDYFYGTGKLAK